ncbi:MAG: DoxX family protein [Bacteroidota bacterium]|nr:DoxX family protein [Bacteroidota bacterium]
MEIKIIIFYVLLAAYAIPGFIFGFKKLSGHKKSVGHFNRWGYPLWFMRFLGFTEITCSILIWFNATRMYALVVFAILIVGATYTHLKYDSKKEAMKPVIVGTLLVIIFFFTLFIQ